MKKPTRFDREIQRLTRRAIEQSLDSIGLILSAKYRVREKTEPAQANQENDDV
jgi:hypothetical protein